MIKTHDVVDFISSTICEAVNPDEIIIVNTNKVDNQLEVIFTEKDMTETTYRVSVELVDSKDGNEESDDDESNLSDDDKEIIKRNTYWNRLIEDLGENSKTESIVKICKIFMIKPSNEGRMYLFKLPAEKRAEYLNIINDIKAYAKKHTNIIDENDRPRLDWGIE